MTFTVNQVDAIVAEPDPVLRNLRISVAYGRMGTDFADRVDRRNLSWCGFGTWASEGVGRAIRHHQTDRSLVLRTFRRLAPRHYAGVAVVAADAFARGNCLVFDHIGRAFAGFHAAMDDARSVAMDDFLAALPVEEPEGVDLEMAPPLGLPDAFRAYLAAIGEDDPRRRAQLVALANLCVAYVEQVRLQEPIETAFASLLPAGWRRPHAEMVLARLLTETTLTLPLGDETVRPGRRMPRLEGRSWPADLTDLDADLFGRFGDLTSNHRPEADDWRSLRDRLRYIGGLMRSRQQARGLFEERPFTSAQIDEIEAGQVPEALRPKAVA
jgi:hypothetical protein